MNFDLNIPMDEEQENTDPHEIISSCDVEKVLQANIIYLKKKRKFQTEQTDLRYLRFPKHKCRDRNLYSDSDSPSEETPINDYDIHILKGKDISETINNESVKDSNTTNGNNMDYSLESVSNKGKTISDISISNSDTSVTLSDYGSSSSDPFSLETRSKLPKHGGDCSYLKNDYGLHDCLAYDESLLEFGCGESSDTEQCKDKEIEDMLYSNGMPPDYVLSYGKWSFNQEKQGGPKKLTIDKAFEEYFSMLML